MASVFPNEKRGTWLVQYHDGTRWRRVVVIPRRPGWKPGDPMPRKVPPEATAALAEYARVEKAAKNRRGVLDPRTTVAEFLAEYLRRREPSVTAATLLQLRLVIDGFLGWCGGQGISRLDRVNSTVCHRWMDDRATTTGRRSGQPLAHATLKKERALLAAAWAQAFRREEIERNPWLPVEVPGKSSTRKRESWTPEQVAKLVAVSRPWLRDVILLGVNTGLRITALRLLEWRDVEWAREGRKGFGLITVRPELDKAGKGYKVAISPGAHDLLMRRLTHKNPHATIILTGAQGRAIGSTNVTARAIRAACRRAGLDDPSSPNHHMRRTFGRWAAMGHLTGSPLKVYVISQWFGHSSIAQTLKYLDMTEDDSQRFMAGDDD